MKKSIDEMKVELKKAKGKDVEVRPTVYDPTLQRKHPELEEAIKGLEAGKTTHEQLDKLIAKHKPVKPYEFIPKPATDEDAHKALMENKKPHWRGHEKWPAGRKVGLRLDIPAYENHGVWVNSIHDEEGSGESKHPTAYHSVSSVKNAEFDPKPSKAMRVGTGEQNKSPFARIKGDLHHMTEDEAVEHMKKYLNHPEYVQVGFDPRRHGYFYDRKNQKPVTHSSHVVQIGPLVLAHKPTYGERESYAYGGVIHKDKGGLVSDKERKANLAKMLKPSAVKKRLYHGTRSDITEVDPSKSKRLPGFWMSSDPKVADAYSAEGVVNPTAYPSGANIMPVHAQITKPYKFNPKKKGFGQAFDEYLNGDYDGFIHENTVVVKHPHQVKSAIGNRGTYDTTDPDITKAEGGSIQGKTMPTIAQMKMALSRAPDLRNMGVDQAIGSRVYANPDPKDNGLPPVGGVSDKNGLPVGGVDQDHTQPGQQMVPQTQGVPQQGGIMQPQPNAGVQGPPPEMGNMLSMTQQGQTLNALGAPAGMPQKAEGGSMPVYTHHVVDPHDNHRIMGKYRSATAARKARDRMDNQYGAYRYKVTLIPQAKEAMIEAKKRGGHIDEMKAGGGEKYIPPGLGRSESEPRLERAKPKTSSEIDEIARRIASQMNGEWQKGGKTQQQLEREKTLEHDIRPMHARTPRVKDVDLSKHMKKVMVTLPGDYTLTDQILHGIGGRKLAKPVRQEGGPRYGLTNPHLWASSKDAAQNVQNVAKTASRQYGDAEVLANYLKMGPDAAYFAKHFADTILSAIDSANLSPKEKDQLTDMLRHQKYQYGDFSSHPSAPSFRNMEKLRRDAHENSNLRKHLGAFIMAKKHTKPFDLISGQDILHATSEPELRNLETGVTGHTIGRFDFDKPLTESKHNTYSHDIPGAFMGKLAVPVPYELSFPDATHALRNSLNPLHKGPNLYGTLRNFGGRQIIDQQLVDEIGQYRNRIKQLTGKKKGGQVNKDMMKLELSKKKVK